MDATGATAPQQGGNLINRVRVLSPLVFLLAAAFFANPAARAQNATPAATTALPPLLQQMEDAINATDGAAIAALYTEDGIHEDVPAGVMAQGHQEEIAAFVDGVTGQFGDVRFESVSGRQAGDLAVLEYDFSIVDLATERPVTYRGVLVFELKGTLIRRSADYYDLASILVQLGQLEPGEVASGATPAP